MTLNSSDLPPDIITNTPKTGDYIFISYARKNSDFAQDICKWLNSESIDYWIDKEDIDNGDNWWEAICEGIRGSVAIIFILTPEIINSAVSQLEFEYALKQGKQIIVLRCINPAKPASDIELRAANADTMALEESAASSPVVINELKKRSGTKFKTTIREIADDNWLAISSINWNFWTATESTQEQHKSLLEAIQTNTEYKRLHRRLALLAEDWESKGRASSYFLRGTELRRAEEWAIQAQDPLQRPQLNETQRDYIRASRRAANRYLQVVTVIAVIVAVTLGVLAIRERIARADAQARAEEAINERNNAQNVLQTFAMVDNTIKQSVGTSPRPLLLFGTDLWVSNYGDGTVTRLAADSGAVRGDPIPVGRSPLTPLTDRRYVWVINSEDSTITRIDPQAPETPVMVEVGDDPRSLFIAGDWIWVTTGRLRTKVLVQVDRESAQVAQSVEIGRLNGEVTFDGTYFWASIADARQLAVVRVHSVTGERLQIDMEKPPYTPIYAFGSVWLTMQDSNTLLRLDPASGTVAQTYNLEFEPSLPQWDDRWLWFRTDSGLVQFSPETGKIVRQLAVISSRPIFREGNRVWVFSGNTLSAYDVNTGRRLLSRLLSSDYSDPLVIGDNLWLINTREDVILMLRMSDGEVLRTLPNCNAPTQPVFDGVNLWVACRDENTIARIPALISYYGANELSANPDPYTPVYTAIGDQAYLWIVQQRTGQVVQFDAQNGRVLATIPVGEAPLPPVYDGERYLWVASSTGRLVTRVDTQDVRVYTSLPVNIAEIAYIEWLKGRVWVTGSSGDRITDIDLPDAVLIDPQRLRIIREHEFGIGASRPVYDDRYDVVWVSATETTGGVAYRLNPETGEILSEDQIGYVSRESVLNGDDAWIASLYPMEAEDVFAAVLQADSGALYRLSRATGQRAGDPIDLEELPSLPLIAGGYIWITQGSFELETSSATRLLGGSDTGANPRGVVAIDPQTGEEVARLSPCRNVGTSYYDEGGYIWGICIGFEDIQHDDSSKIFVIDPETQQIVAEHTGIGRFPWPAQRIDGRIWVVFQESNNIAVFDPTTAQLLRVFGVGNGASLLTYDGGNYAWLSNGDDGTVQRVTVRFP